MESKALGQVCLIFFRSLSWLYAIQPGWARAGWGRLLGFFLKLLSFRKKVIVQNLELAFPGPELASERTRLYQEAYRHLGNLFLELLLLFGALRWFTLRNAELKGLEHWQKAKSEGKGIVFLSSHVGNWEIMAASGALFGAMDVLVVTKKLKPGWIHAAIEQGRAACGIKGTYEPQTFRDVLSHLKKNGTIGFVLDQYAGPPVGVRVPFFGVPVGTHATVATLARRTGAVVLPVVNRRLPDGRWETRIEPPVEWKADENPQREVAVNTAHYTSILEGHVRACPGQWLWTHRRFKGDLSPLSPDEWSEGRNRR